MKDALNYLLGTDNDTVEPYQMAIRAALVFFLALAYIRSGGLRMVGRQSAYDTLTALMLGAIMGRAVVSHDSFWGAMLAAVVIMVLHKFVAWITFKSSVAGSVLKGKPIILYQNSKPILRNLSRVHITENDLKETVRKNLNTDDMTQVKEIYMDRSGEMSVIKYDDKKT